MRILVTGAAGVIGRHVVRELVEAGHSVVAHDLRSTEWMALSGAEIIVSDLTVEGEARRLVLESKPDGVVHAAATVSFRALSEQPVIGLRINVQVPLELALAARDGGVGRFVLLSSRAVYGLQDSAVGIPALEDGPLHPHAPYDAFKVAAEVLCARTLEGTQTKFTALRFATIFGRGKDVRHSTASILSRIIEVAPGKGPMLLPGQNDEPLDLIYVKDAARAVANAALLTEIGDTGPINVGSGGLQTTGDLIEAVLAHVPLARFQFSGVGTLLTPKYRLPLDTTRAKALLGFSPRFDLASGIADYLASPV